MDLTIDTISKDMVTNAPFEVTDKILKEANARLKTIRERPLLTKNIVIYGSPKAWKRHRSSKFSGMYNPSAKEEQVIQSYFIEELGEDFPMIHGEVFLSVDAYRPIPKSMPKSLAILYDAKALMPTSKPDVDNLCKIIQDALNKVIYNDDSQITFLKVNKYLSFTPRTEITLSYFNNKI